MEIVRYSSGAPLEEKVGYSRMVKAGNMVFIGGTTSVQPDGTVYGDNAYEQAKYVFKKQIDLLEKAGAKVEDVIKVDCFLTHMSDCAEVCRAYSEYFHDIKPLCTCVATPELNRETQLCEIEMMAVIE